MLRFLLALAVLSCAAVVPRTARAYENQVTVGIDAGYALAKLGSPSSGLTLGADASVGLSDLFSLRFRLGYAYHPADGGLHAAVAGGELLYLVDILAWVPYFGVGADAFFTAADGHQRGDLGLHAVVGVEWLASRDWLLGIDVRPFLLPLAFHDSRLRPVYFTVTARFSLIFDL